MGITDILSGNAKKAANKQVEGLMKGQSSANNSLMTGLGQYETYAGKALGEYAPYEGALQQGASTYADALGLNGATGAANARSTFQTAPGYEFQQEQGLQALERSAASRGMLASGNTSADILGYSQGLADQSWSSWLDRLNGLGTQGIGVAGQQAGIQTGIGNANAKTYGDMAQIGWNAETGAGNARSQQASAEGAGILGGISLGTKLLGQFAGGGFG